MCHVDSDRQDMLVHFVVVQRASGVTTAPATSAMQGGHLRGGGRQITEFAVFKRKIFRLGSKMHHILTNLAFDRREKKIYGYKKL